jgi:DNA replicative helicase MCM subunit Mcm2 (Cdc46/Mcm family)
MTTILSRFDLFLQERDIRDEDMDRMICQHVMGVHISSSGMRMAALVKADPRGPKGMVVRFPTWFERHAWCGWK